MLAYETLLDLARQRLRDIASSPNFTRPTRELALALERTVRDELDALNAGKPVRRLTSASRGLRVKAANDGGVELLDGRCG